MRLIEVFERPQNIDAIKRKIASLTALIDDPTAFPNEKQNATILRDKLVQQLNAVVAIDEPCVLSNEQMLIDVFQRNAEYYINGGFNWMKFIEILQSTFGQKIKVLGKSPSNGDYSISTNYNTNTLTIAFSRCYMNMPQIQHFLGKLLFSDIRPILDRMDQISLTKRI